MEAEVQQHPVELGNVFAAITGAFSLDAPVRNASEASLKEWEADAVPGFLAALLNILEHCKDEARSVPPSCMVHVKGDVYRAIKDNTLSHCSMISDDACELVCGDHIWDPPRQHRKLERYLLQFPGCQQLSLCAAANTIACCCGCQEFGGQLLAQDTGDQGMVQGAIR